MFLSQLAKHMLLTMVIVDKSNSCRCRPSLFREYVDTINGIRLYTV